MRILHITAWFPSESKPLEALWIRRLIRAIPEGHQHRIYHIAVTTAERFRFEKWDGDGVHHCVVQLPTKRWLIVEIVNFALLLYYIAIRRIHRECDVVNFHVAYPQLVFWGQLKYLVRRPVLVFEHWSAYHFSFGVKKRLPRIQRIFRHGLPLITVSKSLLRDIEVFSGYSAPMSYVLPNTVDIKTFARKENVSSHPRSFLMLSQWKPPKRPDVIINAFAQLIEDKHYQNYTLRIGGYGVQLAEMRVLVDSLGLSQKVSFLGPLDSTQIAIEMNQSALFLHCSDYETFSVVCAEALCCGTPVVASAVGGIMELLNDNNGRLVTNNTVAEWLSALRHTDQRVFDREGISCSAHAEFCMPIIGSRYLEILKEVSRGATR